ncbi:MAG: ATP-binding protein [Chthoniobacteraceae bacterium]|jgi:signal transduction histidine kinase
MKVAEIIPLTAAGVNLALVLFILAQGTKSMLHRVYAVWGCSIVVWNVGTAFMFSARNPEQALIWARFLHFGVVFLPVSLFHLCLLITQISMPRLVRAVYGFAFCMAALNCTGLLVSGVHDVGYAYYSVGGPLYFVFVAAYAGLTWATMLILFWRGRKAPPFLKSRINSMRWASGILIAFGNNDLLPILGIYHYPFTNIEIFPFGSLAAIVYGLLVGYSTLQHQLLDVQVVIGRFVAHGIRLLFMWLIGLVLLVSIWALFPAEFSAASFVAAFGVLAVSSAIASFLFPRLFGSGSDTWERRFLGDRFEYHDQIRAFIPTIQQHGDSDMLLDGLHELLTKVVRVRNYRIILRDEDNRVFAAVRSYSEHEARPLPELNSESPIFRFFERTGAEYIGSKLLHALPGTDEIERRTRELLNQCDAEFCLPLVTGLDVFGLLLLGEKADDSPYTATDISLLCSLTRQLSLFINQLRLKNQVLQAQEAELLGRMSRGMAHDMNNLVTPVQTLMQLIAEGVPVGSLRDELLPLATRSIDTLREYIREALFFSEHACGDFKLGRLDMVLAESVAIVASRCEQKGIKMILQAPQEALVEMDKSLIKRTITNVLGNAIDASTGGAEIRVELFALEKTEPERDWFRVRIIDQGEGIHPENMQRIFTPYFTTKNRGDDQRGFGLGLSICRKVVQIHGGSLKITSQPKKGTTVLIDLPDHQLRNPSPTLAPAT